MKYLLVCLVLQIILSCKNEKKDELKSNKEENFNIIKLDKIDAIEDKLIDLDSIFENFRYVKLETTEISLIGNYDKILIENDIIFILDKSNLQQSIFSFDMKGKFLFKVNARGRGPGEYLEISDFYVDKELKYIGVLFRSKILKYNFKGEFIGEFYWSQK